MDFGHLKSLRSIDYFANRYADRQPELFTPGLLEFSARDILLEDIRRAAQPLLGQGRLYSTFLVPFMVALKSSACRSHDAALAAQFDTMKQSLPT